MLIDGRKPAQWEKLFKNFDFMAQLAGSIYSENEELDREILAALACDDVATRRVAASLADRESLKTAITQLLAALDDRDSIVVARMLHSLATHRIAATLPHQVRMLEHADAIVRVAAAESIGSTLQVSAMIEPVGSALSVEPTIIDALNARLADRDPTVRAAAALALAEAGSDAAPAADGLAKLLDERDSKTRRAATHALVKCGARPDLLVRAIRDPDTRKAALSAFSVGPDGLRPPLEVLPALIEALGDHDELVVSSALRALGSLGAKAAVAVEPIAKLLSGKRQRGALSALASIGAPAAAVMPALAKALLDPNLALNAAHVLEAIGAPALPVALIGLRERDTTIRRASMHVVARQLDEPAALDAVCALLRDANPRVRYETVLSLFDATLAARPAKAALVRAAAEDPDAEVRNAARFTHEKLD